MQEHCDLAKLRELALNGTSEAWHKLARALVMSGQVEEAFSYYQRAANSGHTPALIECAKMLLYGIGRTPDPALAVHLLLEAQAAGEVAAGYQLALIAAGATALPFDERINVWVLAAVNADYPPALRAAAIHFGRKPNADDQSLCLALLDKAAQAGDKVAALLLAERLRLGEGCTANPTAAAELLAQLASHGIAPLPHISIPFPVQPPSTPRTLALQDAMLRMAPEVLSPAPPVAVIEGLLSADECRLLIATSIAMLKRSNALDPVSGQPQQLALRTSSDASYDSVMEDLALRLVQLRIATAAGLSLANAESLTVLRYLPGQEYRPHRDYLHPNAIARDRPEAGNRLRTICVYLNHVQAGGQTTFPKTGITVQPQPGRAVLFDNLNRSGLPEQDSLHAGLPVREGEKWLATLWLRQHQYREF